ncbi:MAG: PHP-associated domain-containing protein [Halodesulfurarchaeum sp.]
MAEAHVDLHVKILEESVRERAIDRGLDVLVYAPHFTRYETARKRARQYTDRDLLVLPAREIFAGHWTRRRHVLALDLEAPIPDFITLSGLMEELQNQDATVLAPHPTFLTVGLEPPELKTYRDTLDAIEVYNPKHWPLHNRRARSLAEDLDLPVFGSSYAHLPPTVGEVWTSFETSIDGEADLIDALTDGTSRRVERRDGYRHDLRRAIEFAHLGWENSWQKFDRLFLSGIEPTHPDHVAYDGRFDDVSVY